MTVADQPKAVARSVFAGVAKRTLVGSEAVRHNA